MKKEKTVLKILRPYLWLMVIAWSLMLIELIVELLSPLIMAKIIDEGIITRDMDAVYKWGTILVGFSLLAFTAGIINTFVGSRVSQNYGYDLRKKSYQKIQRLSFEHLSKYPTSTIITRLTNDVTQIQNTLFMSLRFLLRMPLLIIFGSIMAVLVNAKLALIMLLTIPVSVIFLIWMMKRGIRFFQHVQKSLDRVNGVMRENLMAMRLIKVFNRSTFEVNRFFDVNQALRNNTVKALRLVEITGPLLLLIMNLCIVLILWLGRIEIAIGGVGAGDVVAIITYATRITHSLSMLSWIIMTFSRAKASADRVNAVLNMEEETDIDTFKESKIQTGSIEFKNVSFQYSHNTPVLENISFKVNDGETLAIIGATGSGKTSLFQLIPRLFSPTEGCLFIDGKNINQLPAKELRNQIGYVTQEAHLFTGTIKDNIAWGKKDASFEEIVQAAKDAQIHEAIMRFPQRYETIIGQKGVNLSGGQKQRLSIARALVRKPKILLLDDATSALDMKTERNLLNSLQNYHCTTLIITQKITTALQADSILLLDEGNIVAKGSHTELLKESALYQKIFESQKESGVLADDYATKY